MDRIDGLYKLCIKQPFDIEEIQCFIKSNKMNSEEVTRVALKLCDYGMFCYSDYLYEYEKEPQPGDLRTYNWELLFNILIDNGLDDNFIMDIDMGLYPHKWQVDNAFRFWLVLIGYGGVIKGDKIPVDMCENYSPQIFREFEKFDYNIIYANNDFELKIIEKETNNLVATV